MRAINPATITLARESRGWTQKQLAKSIGTEQGTICKYELALLRVSPTHADAISRVLQFDPLFFEQPDQILGLGGDFLYRKRASVSARLQKRIQAEANILKMQAARLLQGAAIESRFPFPSIQPEEVDGRIERAAQEVRKAWRILPGPIPNITRAIESAGAIIFVIDFETDLIDGTNIRVPTLPPMLFLNRAVSGERHRMNLAHELGHLIMHFTTTLGDAEDEAYRFAQEFLMPKTEVRSDLKNLDLAAAARLKGVWGVSMAAIIMRARSVGQISEASYRRLFTALNAKGLRSREPLPIKFEQPESFERLKSIHREKLGLSEDDMRRILFTDRLGIINEPEPPTLRLTGGLFEESQ